MTWVIESIKQLIVRADDAPKPRTILSDREAALYAALKTEKRRRDWLAARWAAKRLIAEALETSDLRSVEIRNDADGRPWPYCPGTRAGAWTLSLTHSGELAGAAVDPSGLPVGFDVEKIEPRDPAFLPVAFTAAELTERDADTVTRLWTVKEAVLKLLGLGLSADLHDVQASPELVLRGKAARRLKELGSPRIHLSSRKEGEHWATLAFAAKGD